MAPPAVVCRWRSLPNNARNPTTGHRLSARIVHKDTTSRVICVLAHGMCDSKDFPLMRRLADGLPCNTCSFDFAGNGESEGEFRYAGYERELSDLRTIVTALRSDHWDVQALLGHSKGAHCVLRYAWTYDDVPLVVSVAARFDFLRMPSSRFSAEQMTDLQDKGGFTWRVRGKELYISREDFTERDGVDMTRVEDIKQTRLVLLHGEEDAVIPVGDAHTIASHLPTERYRLKSFRGAGHNFESDEERERLIAYVHGVLDVWMWVCQRSSV